MVKVTSEEALRLKQGDMVRLIKAASNLALGQIGSVSMVIYHQGYGGLVEVVVDWPDQGPAVMDPGILEAAHASQ